MEAQHHQNDDGEGREGGGNVPVQQQLRAIESLDDYVNRFGLPHANGDDDDQTGGEFNGLTRSEADAQVRAEKAYLDEIIQKHQHQQSLQPEASPHTHPDAFLHPEIEEENDGGVISVQLSNNTSRIYPIQPLMALCETATRMVTWRKRCGSTINSVGNVADKSSESTVGETSSSQELPTGGVSIMELSLVEFDADATISFMEVIISLHNHSRTFPKPPSPTRKRQIMDNDTDDEFLKHHLLALINHGMISEIHIVECLKLSHYLQCRIVLDTLASIVEQSIDSHNCMAICSIADALNLKTLFEASVNFVIERLDAIQGTGPAKEDNMTRSSCSSGCDDSDGRDEFDDVWTSLPHDLRSRVLTMRNVLRSSVVGRGSKVSGLFFSSAAEFLAIFHETIRDQEERLAESRKRCDELIRERNVEWAAMCQRRGPWFDRTVNAQKEFVYGADVMYSLGRIQRQSQRLKTLRSFYEDQKIIFKDGGFGSEIIL